MKNFKKYYKLPYNKTRYFKVQQRNERFTELRVAIIEMIKKENLDEAIYYGD